MLDLLLTRTRARLRNETGALFSRLYGVAFLLTLLGIFVVALAEFAWPLQG